MTKNKVKSLAYKAIAVCSVSGLLIGGLVFASPSFLDLLIDKTAQYLSGNITNQVVAQLAITEDTFGAVSGTDHYQVERFWVGFGGNTLATSTSGTATTLKEKDLFNNSYIAITPNVAAFAYTLPATSTLSTLLKNKGDTQSWIFQNATTTAEATLTLVKGAGWNLTGVDANVDVIAGAAWGSQVYMKVDCVRQADTDIACFITENINAD